MASYVTVTLDTTGPAGVDISIAGGAAITATRDVTAAITTSDSPTTGYQVKIWGDVDPAFNASIQTTEGASAWITLASPHSIRLSTGDGTKTVNVRMRDDVWNESSSDSDTITLDTSVPVVNVTSGPDVTRISKISGKRTVVFTWSSDTPFEEYKVKVVPATGSNDAAGTVVPTTNGSTGVAGSAGSYPASTPITTTIDGRDLELADSGDGAKIIKVFVREAAGTWSV